MADFTLRRARKLLTPADLPLLIHPGTVTAEWRDKAEAKGFTAIARVRDHQHLAICCHTCGGITAVRTHVLMNNNPHCHHCLNSTRQKIAEAAGMRFLRRDPANHKYAFYALECGHAVRRQFGRIGYVAAGRGSTRCDTCQTHREETEAQRFGWHRLARDPEGNASYRLYRHSCGHEQRIAAANMRWGQCDCARCGQSWTAKPSFIYLLDIRHPGTARHFLKLGYSAHPLKRHKHQLGLPKEAMTEVLRVVAMPTGHDACATEKAAHATLRRTHPEAVVPYPEYADVMNVSSEIYRPNARALLQETLDRIEQKITGVAHIRVPNGPTNPDRIPKGADPEKDTPESMAIRIPDPAPQSSATARDSRHTHRYSTG